MSGLSISVLGGGAWGTALALTAARAGHDVRLWARDPATVDAVNQRRENPGHLPGIGFDAGITATGDLAMAFADADRIILAVPAQQLRGVLESAGDSFARDAALVLSAKGIEVSSGKLLSAVVGELLPDHAIAALSGPSFATDVARRMPTAVVVASTNGAMAATIAAELSTATFRCYSTDDLTGVEIGGALKNVLAIAAGIVAGAGLGASAHAAMVTRGFVELRRIAASFGARPETLMGLSGLGDLVLTCGSAQSRNYAYGIALGRGASLDGLPLAEGVPTCGIAARLAADRGIDVPIISAVDRVLQGGVSVRDAVERLMTRPLRGEDE